MEPTEGISENDACADPILLVHWKDKISILNAYFSMLGVYETGFWIFKSCCYLIHDNVAVTETWLDSSVLDHELQLYGYNIYRKDRSGRRGGGVLRAVKSHLTCFRRSDLETDMEMLACLIYTRPAFCLLFSVFYRPPGQNLDFSAKFGAFSNNYSSTNISNLIVLGDFNFPHIDCRTSTSYVSDLDAADFCCLIQDHFLLQVNSNITRYSANSTDSGNILDLVLANNEHFVSDVSVHPDSFNSDYLPVSFAINAKFKRQKNLNREVYCYKITDFDRLRSTLNLIPWDSVILLSNLNDSVTKFQDLLLCAIDRHFPRIILRGRSRPSWITAKIMKLIRKKRALWKRMKITSSPDLFTRFKQLRKQTKKFIATSYHQYLQSLSEKLKVDPKKFWSFHAINSKRLPAVVTYKDTFASESVHKAALFN